MKLIFLHFLLFAGVLHFSFPRSGFSLCFFFAYSVSLVSWSWAKKSVCRTIQVEVEGFAKALSCNRTVEWQTAADDVRLPTTLRYRHVHRQASKPVRQTTNEAYAPELFMRISCMYLCACVCVFVSDGR